jgi:hypothetical protein
MGSGRMDVLVPTFLQTGDIRQGFLAAPWPVTTTVQVAPLSRPELLGKITAAAEVPRERFGGRPSVIFGARPDASAEAWGARNHPGWRRSPRPDRLAIARKGRVALESINLQVDKAIFWLFHVPLFWIVS